MHTELTGNKKRATGFDGMPLQNELNSDVARSTTHVRTCLAINKVARFVLVGGKTRSSYRPTAWLKHPNPNTLFGLPRRRSLGPLSFVSRSFLAKKKSINKINKKTRLR